VSSVWVPLYLQDAEPFEQSPDQTAALFEKSTYSMRSHPTITWSPVQSQGELEPGHAAQHPLAAGDEALLAEAISFFNLQHPAVQRAGWEELKFSKKDLLGQTRADIHDALFEYLLLATHEEHLWALIPSSKMQELLGPPKQTANPKSDPMTAAKGAAKGSPSKPKAPPHHPKHFNHATRAHTLIRALLLPEWRIAPASSSWSTRYQLRPVRWDEIPSRIAQLQQMTRRSAIEDKLKASFGPAMVNPPGGDMGLRLTDEKLPQDSLSERIYSQVGAVITRFDLQNYHGSPIKPEINVNGTPFKLHEEVKDAADSLLQAASPWDSPQDNSFPNFFGNWFETLDRMEGYLAQAASSPVGAAVGAVWGLAMTATLRAYLVDALMSIFMLSMPISRLHDQHGSSSKGVLFKYRFPFGPEKWRKSYSKYYNGMLAVGLWECMTGKLAPHPNKDNDGFLTDKDDDKLFQVMRAWKPEAMPTFWGPRLGGEHSYLTQFINDASSAPCYIWESAADALDKNDKPRSDGSDALLWQSARKYKVQDVFSTWPAHPRFFKDAGKEERARPTPKPADEEDQAGTLFAQLSHFALTTITDHLLSVFGFKGSSGPEGMPYRVGAKRSLIGGGSLMWGGCNYSHKEHRWGGVFDITHPFVHPPWDLRSVVLASGEPARKCYIGTRVHVPNDSDITSIEYNRFFYLKDTIKQKPNQSIEKIIGMDDIVREALEKFTGNKKTKQMPLAEIEKEYLLGTPLMYKYKGYAVNRLQVNMIGHVALLLTAPWKMIMASPIMHLRSINLISEAFKLAELPKFPSFLWPSFYFKPDDHNDHWHVAFWALQEKSSGDSKGLNAPKVRGEDKVLPAETLTILVRFWRDLGVPIQDFATYLKKLELNSGSTPNVARASQEKEALLGILASLEEKSGTDYKARLDSRLKPVVSLLKEPRYVECDPGISRLMSKPGFQKPIREMGVPIREENENERRKLERSGN
jgi:hypothetical protein